MSEAFSGMTHPYQPGWFDLVSVMVEGMIANAGQEQAEAFLHSMGESLATPATYIDRALQVSSPVLGCPWFSILLNLQVQF